MSAQKTSVTYKQKLIEALEMKKRGREAIYERIGLLVSVFDDREFRADNNDLDDIKASEILDGYLEDTALSFLEARAVFLTFPKFSQWQGKTLRDLYESSLESARGGEEETTRQTRRRATLADLETERQARMSAEAESRNLKKQVEELDATNRTLIRENAKLEGRINELERVMKREFANT